MAVRPPKDTCRNEEHGSGKETAPMIEITF
jgi:hypothetical protein